MPSSYKVISRMDERVRELSENFQHFVSVFENSEKFSGPSLYFHKKSLACLDRYGSAAEAIASDEIFEWIYATLASWGMHRMGRGNTKLRELSVIVESIRSQSSTIRAFQNVSLLELSRSDLGQTIGALWHCLSKLTVSIAEARIVANSKVIHHILPRLLPPIDRTYTFNFFYSRNMLSVPEEVAFAEMYSRFHQIGLANKESIPSLIGSRWNTSQTKLIDNAIVGYVIERLRISD
jgi:hypothetical protein